MIDSGFSVLIQAFKHFRISSIVRHTQAYSGVNGYIQECFWYFRNPDIFKTLTYLEPGHIRNPGHIQNSAKNLLGSILRK